MSANVGVVLPVLNGARFVEEAIESVLVQDHSDLELVVVDGGSDDGTRDVVKRYNDPRVELVDPDRPLGLAASRNRGVRALDCDVLAFVDHDDRWRPDKLTRHVRAHRSTGAGLVYSDIDTVDADGEFCARVRAPDPRPSGEPLVRQLLLRKELLIVTMSCVTLRRSAWETVEPFDTGLTTSEDGDLYCRLAGHVEFERIPHALVDRRKHGANTSDDYRAIYANQRRVFERATERYAFLDADDRRRMDAKRLYQRATSDLEAGESRDALRFGLAGLCRSGRVRPLLVVGLAITDLGTGRIKLGRRAFLTYDRAKRRLRARKGR